MENIGCDRNEDVGEWESCPERMDNGLQFGFAASPMKSAHVLICQKIATDHISLCAQRVKVGRDLKVRRARVGLAAISR